MGNFNSGRYKKDSTIARECQLEFNRRADRLWKALIDKAESGNLEALIYVFDRQWGRPRQEIDARIKSNITFSPDDYALMSHVTVTAIEPVIEGEIKELPAGPTDNQDTPADTPQS